MMPAVQPHSTAPISRSSLIRLDAAGGSLQERVHRIVIASGPQAGLSAPLEGTLIVGTHEDCGLRLTDDTVSRYHLELQARPEGVRVRDLDSTNGTFVAGVRIKEAIVDREGTFVAGKTALRVEVEQREVGAPVSEKTQFGRSLGRSLAMRRVFGVLERVAQTDATVLLMGETGTGKELLAEAVHLASPRKDKRFVVIDCSAVAPNLIESELFGHARGAFTGAVAERSGAFLQADGGTVFLDELGELPLELQSRLLRVLETGDVKRVGEDTVRKVDVRVVAATHRDLEAEVAAKRFREDLFYRLAVVTVKVPALRERLDDLPLLAEHFVSAHGRPAFNFSEALLSRLAAHRWPGNVRELRNVVERALAGGGLELGATAGLGAQSAAPVAGSGPDVANLPFKEAKEKLVDAFTREYFTALLAKCDGNVSEVARTAGIARSHVHELLTKYSLKAR